MLRLIAHKLLYLIPILFVVSVATFGMQELIPGDPAVSLLGPDASPAQIEALHVELGFDKPVLERYGDWLGGVVQGDFGKSLVPPTPEVSSMLQSRLPVTLQLAILAMMMSLAISIPVALYSAYRSGERFDRTASTVAFAVISLPSFVTALLLVFTFVFDPHRARTIACIALWAAAAFVAFRAARRVGRDDAARSVVTGLGIAAALALLGVLLWNFWPSFPRQGFNRLFGDQGIRENLRSVFLPAFTLGLAESAVFMRLLRSDLISTLQEDFIHFARAKGMPPRRILVSDALRPSAFSLITVAGVSFGRLIGGTVIVETIFNLPGMGTMIVKAVGAGDFRVVQAGVLVIATFYVVINTLIDISYAYLDPRMRRAS